MPFSVSQSLFGLRHNVPTTNKPNDTALRERKKRREVQTSSQKSTSAEHRESFQSDDSLGVECYLSPQGSRVVKYSLDMPNEEPTSRHKLGSWQVTKAPSRKAEASSLLKPPRGAKSFNTGAIPIPPPGHTFNIETTPSNPRENSGSSSMPRGNRVMNGLVQPRNDLGKRQGYSIPIKKTKGRPATSIASSKRGDFEPPTKRRRIESQDTSQFEIGDSEEDEITEVSAASATPRSTSIPKPTRSVHKLRRPEGKLGTTLSVNDDVNSLRDVRKIYSQSPSYNVNDGSPDGIGCSDQEISREASLRGSFRDTRGQTRGAISRDESPDELGRMSTYEEVNKLDPRSSRKPSALYTDHGQHISPARKTFSVEQILWDDQLISSSKLKLYSTGYVFNLIVGKDPKPILKINPATFKEVALAEHDSLMQVEQRHDQYRQQGFNYIRFADVDTMGNFILKVRKRLSKTPVLRNPHIMKNHFVRDAKRVTSRLTKKPDLFDKPIDHHGTELLMQSQASKRQEGLRPRLIDSLQAKDDNIARYQFGTIDQTMQQARRLRSPDHRPSESHLEDETPVVSHTADNHEMHQVPPNWRGDRQPETRRKTRASNHKDSDDLISPEDDRGFFEVPDRLRYSKTHDLGHPWKRPLVYPRTGKNRATIDFQDLERLDEGEFLNDSLIDFYIRYLAETFPEQAKSVYFYNTYFFTSLSQGKPAQKDINYDAVKKWTSKIDVFNYDFLVVPINENLHWYMAIICNLKELKWHKSDFDEQIDSDARPLSQGKDADDVTIILPDSRPSPNGPFLPQVYTNEIESSDDGKTILRQPYGREMKNTAAVDGNGGVIKLTETEGAIRGAHPIDQSKFRFRHSLGNNSQSIDMSLGLEPSKGNRDEGIESNAESRRRFWLSDKVEKQQGRSGDTTSNLKENHVPGTANSTPSQKKKRRSGPGARTYDPDIPAIVTLDSLGHPHAHTAKVLKSYLAAEAIDKLEKELDVNEIQGLTGKGIPEQNNFSDCGLFLLLYLNKFLQDPKKFTTKLLQKSFDGENDWPSHDASGMRHEMRQLIQDLHEKQEQQHKAEKTIRKASLYKQNLAASEPPKAVQQEGQKTFIGMKPASTVITADESSAPVSVMAFQKPHRDSLTPPPIDVQDAKHENELVRDRHLPGYPQQEADIKPIDTPPKLEARADSSTSPPLTHNISVVIPAMSQNGPMEGLDGDSSANSRHDSTGFKSSYFSSSPNKAEPLGNEQRPQTRGKGASHQKETYSKKGKRRSLLRKFSASQEPEIIQIDD